MRNVKDRIVDYFDDLLWETRHLTFDIPLLVGLVWILFFILLGCGLFFLYKIMTLAVFIVTIAMASIAYKIVKRKIGKSNARR